VYRGRDTKLKRDVAIKVLPETFARHAEREAKVLASLDHPNIGHFYGLVDAEDSPALVLALIEGPTLADRIAVGPIPLDESIHIAQQIAEAFEYAHDRGVIHRDLKPDNIKITPEGTVKVLDFGLQALIDNPAGVSFGTTAYMSPEQVMGECADANRRSDIYAFGAVLYEMLTGKYLFAWETEGEITAGLIKDEPKFAAVPAPLRLLIARCLVREPRRRLQSMGEARLILEDVTEPGSTLVGMYSLGPDMAPTHPLERRHKIAISAALVVAFAAGWAFEHFQR